MAKQKKQLEKWKADKGIKSKINPDKNAKKYDSLKFDNFLSQFPNKIVSDRYDTGSDEESPDTIVPDSFPPIINKEDSKESRASTPNTIIEYKIDSSRNESIISIKPDSSKISEDTDISSVVIDRIQENSCEKSLKLEVAERMRLIQKEIKKENMEKSAHKQQMRQELLRAVFLPSFSCIENGAYNEAGNSFENSASVNEEMMFVNFKHSIGERNFNFVEESKNICIDNSRSKERKRISEKSGDLVENMFHARTSTPEIKRTSISPRHSPKHHSNQLSQPNIRNPSPQQNSLKNQVLSEETKQIILAKYNQDKNVYNKPRSSLKNGEIY